ncbi:MAG: hypothetical protein QGH20_03040 [Candidatus Latescibacteria bacterium]|nr:hypothetical protein [Candidatus Latescibacterota bacterium]
MTIDEIRSRAEKLNSSLEQEYYETDGGFKIESNVAAIVAVFADLCRPTTYDTVCESLDAASDPDEVRRLTHLREFIVEQRQLAGLADITDRMNEAEATAMVDVGGENIPYRMVPGLVRNEDDRAKRTASYDARNEAVEGFHELLNTRVRRMVHGAVDMGFADYLAMFEELSGIAVVPIVTQMRILMEKTTGLYRSCLEKRLSETSGISLSEAKRTDSIYAFRGEEFDVLFPKGGEQELAQRFTDGLGIDLTAGGNVTIDTEQREHKSPRAFCCTVNVPHNVYLVTKPSGGASDYGAFFHELGHALHFGNVGASVPFELSVLGDNSVTESFAFLFENLLIDRSYLELVFPDQNMNAYLSVALLEQLDYYRRYGAKIAYEAQLYDGVEDGLDFQRQRYQDLLSEASMLPWPSEPYLDDVDPFYHATRYLRAWMLSAQMALYFRETFGDRWFADKRTGQALVELWGIGQELSADELSKQFGFETLSVEPMLQQIAQLDSL